MEKINNLEVLTCETHYDLKKWLCYGHNLNLHDYAKLMKSLKKRGLVVRETRSGVIFRKGTTRETLLETFIEIFPNDRWTKQ